MLSVLDLNNIDHFYVYIGDELDEIYVLNCEYYLDNGSWIYDDLTDSSYNGVIGNDADMVDEINNYIRYINSKRDYYRIDAEIGGYIKTIANSIPSNWKELKGLINVD